MSLRLIVIVVAAFLVGAAISFALVIGPGPRQIVQSTGKALVGGPFSLVDHTGKRVSEQDFRGRLMLVTFGFTHCPDVCPAELQVMSGALQKLGAKAERVVPVFITVDPERDTVEALRNYVGNFSPRLIGLTGTRQETDAAAKAFRVYHAKVTDPASNSGYTVDHSALTYLMSAEGEYLAHFPYGTDVDKMAAGIAKFL